MRENQKYPTYFPLIYWVSAFLQRAGLVGFPPWIAAFRWLMLLSNLGAAAVLFWMLYRMRGLWFAVFGALLWFLSRWGIYVTTVAHSDIAAIFLLLLSLWLLPRHKRVALLLYSASLAFKQVAIFLVPLYLLYIWHETSHPRRLSSVVGAAGLIACLPILASLPFMLWPGESSLVNLKGLTYSIMFSATRNSQMHIGAPSVESVAGWTGIVARLPMVCMMLLIYLLYWRRSVGILGASLLTMVVFIDFNPVLFAQYFIWQVPFMPLALAELPPG
jgi:hypothetical protein